MRVKTRIVLYIFLTITLVGIVYLSMELFSPRDFGIAASLDGITIPWKLDKVETNGHYYISFKEQQKGNKKIQLECTKAQYDFIINGKAYHVYYRKNFFDRRMGKIIKLDDKPIYNGNIPIAMWKIRLVV